MFFPDNGDALRRLIAEGDDLSQSRNIDFTVVFPDQLSSEGFARGPSELGYKVSLRYAEVEKGFPWDGLVVKHMLPSLREIEEFETLLQRTDDVWGGQNDGRGCCSHPLKQ